MDISDYYSSDICVQCFIRDLMSMTELENIPNALWHKRNFKEIGFGEHVEDH